MFMSADCSHKHSVQRLRMGAACAAQQRTSRLQQHCGLSTETGARRTTTATAVAACAAAEGARLSAAASNSCRMACVLSTRRSAVRQPGAPSRSAAAALHSGSTLQGKTQRHPNVPSYAGHALPGAASCGERGVCQRIQGSQAR